MNGDAAFLVAWFTPPALFAVAVSIITYRRQGRAGFDCLREPELAIGLLALPAWPVLLIMWAIAEGEERVLWPLQDRVASWWKRTRR